ncbi:hypothetical protein B005_0463 [Nocardiopsis alba ATCC BAA-2165]|uniref:Uncharacterized protein n=1 Tax=Nocardiopsis alba (strain ATCC BAA-2165 / BE74) TaxID=1205910 RepID=J7L6L6_NOCAA|nr:hypothetical protein B005_0463 [Nocardiopsis alba ATCC BAA-2165]
MGKVKQRMYREHSGDQRIGPLDQRFVPGHPKLCKPQQFI